MSNIDSSEYENKVTSNVGVQLRSCYNKLIKNCSDNSRIFNHSSILIAELNQRSVK